MKSCLNLSINGITLFKTMQGKVCCHTFIRAALLRLLVLTRYFRTTSVPSHRTLEQLTLSAERSHSLQYLFATTGMPLSIYHIYKLIEDGYTGVCITIVSINVVCIAH